MDKFGFLKLWLQTRSFIIFQKAKKISMGIGYEKYATFNEKRIDSVQVWD